MNNEQTLRDTLAMSMIVQSFPKLDTDETKIMAKKYGLEWSDYDISKQIEFSFAFESILRYQYADAMLKARG